MYPFATFLPNKLDFRDAKDFEWLLPNGLGGYSSSTILGLNTRKYHGLLISASEDLTRRVYLQKLDEEIHAGKAVLGIGTNQYKDGSISEGYRNLERFEFRHNLVSFLYDTEYARISKQISTIPGKNGITVLYDIENKSDNEIEFRVNLMINSRDIYGLTKENSINFESRIFNNNSIGIKSNNCYLRAFSDNSRLKESRSSEPLRGSDNAVCSEHDGERWHRNIFYSADYERGEDCIEDIYLPAYFAKDIAPKKAEIFTVVALGYDTEERTTNALKELQEEKGRKFRVLSSGSGTSILTLLTTANSFVVKRNSKKTVIAGYHWFADWGRDAMISLPGLTLINGKFRDAELILEHFLNHASNTGIPTRFTDGKPEYYDVDSSLWMIDRLYQYARYVGPDKAKDFLHTYWWTTLKNIINHYLGMEKDGLLMHNSGTWMDTLKRENSVEIQGLWYNALRIIEKFNGIMGEDIVDVDINEVCGRFEKNFIGKFWNGEYLDDCIGDNSLRPNQIIPISLDFNVIDESRAKKVLDVVEKELLTPYGLRTLNRGNPAYKGMYSGNPQDREKAYHNGTVWPWLFGPYISAYMKFYGKRIHAQKLLEPLFEKHTKEAGIGTISEIFDGDEPYKPKGCISQAWSVAELLRAYFEDVMGKKPGFEI